MEERLQKFLAQAGVASRRKAEELIAEGRVKLNGTIVDSPGVKINPLVDTVEVNNKIIKPTEQKVYILLNKPTGYLTTVNDEFGRPTVMQLLKDVKTRVFPVGRLDLDTEGLLLLTNDGDFTYRLTHPKHEKTKTYEALVSGIISEEKLDKLRKGIELEDGLTAPARCRLLKKYQGNSLVEIIIHEGRKRQVRRMFSAIGHEVLKLKRTAEDFLTLGNLKPGAYRYLTDNEVKNMLENK